jgi:hypothetical protein
MVTGVVSSELDGDPAELLGDSAELEADSAELLADSADDVAGSVALAGEVPVSAALVVAGLVAAVVLSELLLLPHAAAARTTAVPSATIAAPRNLLAMVELPGVVGERGGAKSGELAQRACTCDAAHVKRCR